jgi:hypothetical protein
MPLAEVPSAILALLDGRPWTGRPGIGPLWSEWEANHAAPILSHLLDAHGRETRELLSLPVDETALLGQAEQQVALRWPLHLIRTPDAWVGWYPVLGGYDNPTIAAFCSTASGEVTLLRYPGRSWTRGEMRCHAAGDRLEAQGLLSLDGSGAPPAPLTLSLAVGDLLDAPATVIGLGRRLPVSLGAPLVTWDDVRDAYRRLAEPLGISLAGLEPWSPRAEGPDLAEGKALAEDLRALLDRVGDPTANGGGGESEA